MDEGPQARLEWLGEGLLQHIDAPASFGDERCPGGPAELHERPDVALGANAGRDVHLRVALLMLARSSRGAVTFGIQLCDPVQDSATPASCRFVLSHGLELARGE